MDASIAAENVPFLNTLDYIVIATVLLSGLLALIRGFIREFLSLCALVGAYFIAITFYEPAIPMVKSYISDDKFAQWIAIGVVFLAALIVLSILGYFLSGLVKGRVFVWFDRSAGFLYGLLRGVVVLCLIYLVVVLAVWPSINKYEPYEQLSEQEMKDKDRPPELLVNARTRVFLSYGADVIVPILAKILPEDISKELNDEWEKVVNVSKVDIKTTVREQIDDVKEQINDAIEKAPEVIEQINVQ